MPNRTTRVVVPALVAATAIGWAVLVTISIVLTSDHKPQGGLFSIFLTFIATVTICEFVLWAWSGLKAHMTAERQRMSTELAALHHMVIRRFDCLESPTESLPAGTSSASPSGEVVPMPSPTTMAAVRRLAARVTDSDG